MKISAKFNFIMKWRFLKMFILLYSGWCCQKVWSVSMFLYKFDKTLFETFEQYVYVGTMIKKVEFLMPCIASAWAGAGSKSKEWPTPWTSSTGQRRLPGICIIMRFHEALQWSRVSVKHIPIPGPTVKPTTSPCHWWLMIAKHAQIVIYCACVSKSLCLQAGTGN